MKTMGLKMTAKTITLALPEDLITSLGALEDIAGRAGKRARP
jgi:hypothetical protein